MAIQATSKGYKFDVSASDCLFIIEENNDV